MVTWQALLSVLVIVVGVILAGFGALDALASGMSDAPEGGNIGCAPFVVGLVLVVAGIGGLLL